MTNKKSLRIRIAREIDKLVNSMENERTAKKKTPRKKKVSTRGGRDLKPVKHKSVPALPRGEGNEHKADHKTAKVLLDVAAALLKEGFAKPSSSSATQSMKCPWCTHRSVKVAAGIEPEKVACSNCKTLAPQKKAKLNPMWFRHVKALYPKELRG